MSAAAVAAIIQTTRENIALSFLDQGALNREKSIVYHPINRSEEREFDHLQRIAVVKGGEGDTFYLDVPTFIAWRKKQRRDVRTLFAVAGAVLLAGAGIGLILG